MTHHTNISVVAAIGLVAFVAAQAASGAIYLKADATGTADGTSWANAYTDVCDAFDALNAAGAGGELRIAGGVYVQKRVMTITGADVRVAGGYRAAEDGDEVRDIEAYQTVFTTTALDAKHPELAHGFPRETGALGLTNAVKYALYRNGRLVFPEEGGAFAGDYDFFYRDALTWDWSYNAKAKLLTVAADAGGTISGLNFVYGERGSDLVIDAKTLGVTVEDCGFYCGYPQGGLVAASSGPNVFRRCKFKYNYSAFGGGVFTASGKCVIEDCEFSDNYPVHYWGKVLVTVSGVDLRMRRCTFARNYIESQTSSTEGGLTSVSGALGVSDAMIEDCVFSNNFVSVSGDATIALVEAKKAHLKGCVFANNELRFAPSPGLDYAFVQASYAAYNNSLDGCLFVSNRIVATSAPTGDFAAAMVASGYEGSKLGVVNTAFIGNGFEVELVDGVDAALSRGVLTRASQANSASEIGIANCTFVGPDEVGVKDVIQLGAGHAKPLNVVNCVFMNDAVEPVNPFRFDVPGLVTVADCTIKNMLGQYLPQDVDLSSGLEMDEIPFATDVRGGACAACRPAAKTPGIRASADVAVNGVGRPMTYQFKLRGEGSVWQALTPAVSASVSADPTAVGDLFGGSRSFGSMTRGAVQTLAAPAEGGVSLTLRVTPLMAGLLSRPSTQATETDGAIEPVMVRSTGDNNFAGWYGTDGKLFSDANPLEIAKLSEDLVLTANFATRKVTIRFDLDGKGTFDVCGESVTNVTASAGDPFPEMPAFTVADGYVFIAVDFPPTVPDTDEVVVAKPDIVTKSLRVIYAVPRGTGRMDGTDWDNAYGDVIAAVADAGKYRGEVRLRGGRYMLDATVNLKSNVSVVGGFGGEPTVLSGDVGGDDAWQSVLGGAVATQCPVWNGDTGELNMPNPAGEHDYWKASLNLADNTMIGFQPSDQIVSNIVFSGLTFTGFRCSAIYTPGLWSDMAISNCTFVACGGSAAKDATDTTYHAVHGSIVGNFRMEDVRFVGNTCCARLPIVSDLGYGTNVIRRCELIGNNTRGLDLPSSVASEIRVENLYALSNGIGSWVCFKPSNDKVREYLLDSSFIGNRFRNGGCSVLLGSAGTLKDTMITQVRGCRFEDNVLAASDAADATPGINIERYANTHQGILIADCNFLRNRITASGSGEGNQKKSTVAAAVLWNCFNYLYFADCTFADNVVNCSFGPSPLSCASIIQISTTYDPISFCNCTFARNSFVNGNERCGEIVRTPNCGESISVNLNFYNCLMGDYAEPHRSFSLDKFNKSLSVYNSVVEGLRLEDCGIDTGTLTTNDVSAAKPPYAKPAKGLDGRTALGVACTADMQFRRRALPMSLDRNGYPFVYFAGVQKPWHRADGDANTESAAASRGVSLDNLKPDAFGQTRRLGHLAYGPINAEKGGLLLLVR